MRGSILVLILFMYTAHAGNRVGNGGDVVTCAKPAQAQLLDFYEMESSDKPLVGVKGKDVDAILKERLEILRHAAPKLADQYLKRSQEIFREISFKSGVALTNIKDSEHAYLPEGCELKQIAIRQNLPLTDKRFLVDQKLWNELSVRSRAGLILHETIYEHFFKLGEETSAKARRLNALVFSPELESMTSGKFWLFIKSLDVPLYP